MKTRPHRTAAISTIVVLGLALGMLALGGTAVAQPGDARGVDDACEFVDHDDPELQFPDIGGLSDEAQDAIRCAVAYGVVAGHADGTYRPGEDIRRHEMALFLSRVLGYAEAINVLDLPDDPDHPFQDIDGVSPAAQSAIALVYELEITTGTTETTYSPFETVTRRDMASFLVRLQDVLEPGSYDTDETDIFPDVPPDLPRDEDINALAMQGIVQGFADGTYRPFETVTRGHMALFVMRHVDENVASFRLLAEDAVQVSVEGHEQTDTDAPTEYAVRAFNFGDVTAFEDFHILLNIRATAVTADDVTVEVCDDPAEVDGVLSCPDDEWTELPLEEPGAEVVFTRLPGVDETFALPADTMFGTLVQIAFHEEGEYQVLAELVGDETDRIYHADAFGVVAGPWFLCESERYSVEYPAHWTTHGEPVNGLTACSLFDPDPDEVAPVNDEVPGSVGVFMRIDDVAFDDVVAPGPHEEVLSREETTVDGRAAQRIEVVATGEGLFPEGTRTTRWAVDLDTETFIAVSRDIGMPFYWQKVLVLDQMMATVDFE